MAEFYSAGSPTDASVKWCYLRPSEIREKVEAQHQLKVSHGCIKRILKAQGWSMRKPAKVLPTGESPSRREQFRVIIYLVGLFEQMGDNPILSIDTKKKEPLGALTRNTPLLVKKGTPVTVYDHDFSYLAQGKAIPHGIFDLKRNQGYLTIGNSHETADFVVENLQWWWDHYGIHDYPDATSILILCDSGGANGHRHYRFRKRLQDWARDIGITIVVAHYPPYCSKYNPIERKLFCHVHRTIEHTILTSLEQIKERFLQTKTEYGLGVVVRILDKHFPLQQPSLKHMIDPQRIAHHPELPKFSYRIFP